MLTGQRILLGTLWSAADMAWARRARMRTYTAYSVGVGIVCAVLLVLVSLFDSADRRKNIFLVFLGFVIGWVSATIGRNVYPPPKTYRQDAGMAS